MYRRKGKEGSRDQDIPRVPIIPRIPESFKIPRTQGRFVPQEVRENAPDMVIREKRIESWVDRAVEEHRKNGGFEDLPGKGKPLKLSSEDILTTIMKNAQVRPPWLELQHEVRDSLKKLAERVSKEQTPPTHDEVAGVNEKIALYNKTCPSPLLQKPYLTQQTLDTCIKRWT